MTEGRFRTVEVACKCHGYDDLHCDEHRARIQCGVSTVHRGVQFAEQHSSSRDRNAPTLRRVPLGQESSRRLLAAMAVAVAVLCTATVAAPSSVFASTLYSQTVTGTQSSFGSGTDSSVSATQGFGTGLSGVVTSITVNIEATSTVLVSEFGGSILFDGYLVGCNSASPSGNFNTGCTYAGRYQYSQTTNLNAGSYLFTLSTSTGAVLDSSKYYFFYFSHPDYLKRRLVIKGASSNVYSGGACNDTILVSSRFRCGSVADLYFVISGGQIDFQVASTTQIIAVYGPAQASLATSGSVDFGYRYYVASPVEYYAGFELQDLTSGQSLDVSGNVHAISSSGYANFATTTLTLALNHTYRWRPALTGGSSNVYGSWRTFYTGTSTEDFGDQLYYGGDSSITLPGLTASSGTSTISLDDITVGCTESGFICLLADKFPFSYLIQVGNLTKGMLSADPASVVISVNFPVAVGSSSPLVFIDLDAEAERDSIQTMRSVIAGIIWVLYAFWLYKFVTRIV